MRAPAEERVAKGAALMDEKVPGWAEKVDKSRLNISSCADCILGQTFVASFPSLHPQFGYYDATEFLGLHGRMDADCGFRSLSMFDAENRELNAAWLAEIDRRVKGSAD
jgi:hypothetical protein